MSFDPKKFLDAEKTATELLESIKALKNEMVSYKTSTMQLEDVKKKLLIFIENSEKISNDTKKAVEILKSIGGPEILNSIEQLEKQVGNNGSAIQKSFSQIWNEIEQLEKQVGYVSNTIDKSVYEIQKDVKSLTKSLNELRIENSSQLHKLFISVIITLIISVLSLFFTLVI